jgi:hypothetical protein
MRCASAVLIAASCLAASACQRETIGLGRSSPEGTSHREAGAPATSTSAEPMNVPDAAPKPSASVPPPTKPPVRLPTYPKEHDAGLHHPTEPEHPPAEPDAGHLCKSNTDCDPSTGTPFCRVDTGKCVKCLGDFSCPANAPRCDPGTNECQCYTTTDCRLYGACDPLTRTCLLGCTSENGCSTVPFAPFCAVDRGICVECRTSDDCKDKTWLATSVPICHDGLCIQCAADNDCPEASRHCSTREWVCVECLRPEHCAAGSQCLNAHCVPGVSTP